MLRSILIVSNILPSGNLKRLNDKLNVFGSKADEVVKIFCRITSVIDSLAVGLIVTL